MTTNIAFVPGEKGKDVFSTYYVQDNLIHAGHQKKIFLGNHTKRVCRFCRRDTSSTTFRQDTHLIPELMGNNILFSYFECDECNARFSKYESAFANYFNINHSFARLKGKRKIPEYYSKNEKFRVVPGTEDINMHSGIGNESVTINEQTQLMTIKTVRPSYIPCDVLKCLVKIGLCAIFSSDQRKSSIV
ncbi:MAG TPA: HNH endonuclease [Cyclobacteriaceae bacterium]|nr:HNH endonuclease [Cyclobacteriaceae bacterium]